MEEDKYPKEIKTDKCIYHRFYVRPFAICYEMWNKHFIVGYTIFSETIAETNTVTIEGKPYYSLWKEMEAYMDKMEAYKFLKLIAA